MALTFILAADSGIAHSILTSRLVALTVEAEYGAFVAQGSIYTAAHHQREGRYSEAGQPS